MSACREKRHGFFFPAPYCFPGYSTYDIVRYQQGKEEESEKDERGSTKFGDPVLPLSQQTLLRHRHDTCKSSPLQYLFRERREKIFRMDRSVHAFHIDAESVSLGMQPLSSTGRLYPARVLFPGICIGSPRSGERHPDQDIACKMQALRVYTCYSSGRDCALPEVYFNFYQYGIGTPLCPGGNRGGCLLGSEN